MRVLYDFQGAKAHAQEVQSLREEAESQRKTEEKRASEAERKLAETSDKFKKVTYVFILTSAGSFWLFQLTCCLLVD